MAEHSRFRNAFWIIVALVLFIHVVYGWFFSNTIIDEAFAPDPATIILPAESPELFEVSYHGELGDMEAWHIPAAGSTWVIHVHDKGGTPGDAEHLFAPLHDAGYPQLSIAYRNDDGQPEDPTGYVRYGATEWADIEAAMDFAIGNGAESIVFSGFGVGGSHVLAFMYRNNLDEVKGVLLDSPNIDLGDTVDFRAGQRDMWLIPMTMWPTITWVSKFATSLRLNVNWKVLDYVDKAASSMRRPALVHHGTADTLVPVSQSIAFAEAVPDLVRLVRVEGAEHLGAYEADPDRYVDEVLSFLAEIG